MVRGIALLLGFQLVGELIVWAGHLPISGPICGMAALLVWLCWDGRVCDDLGKVTDALLTNMAILFVHCRTCRRWLRVCAQLVAAQHDAAHCSETGYREVFRENSMDNQFLAGSLLPVALTVSVFTLALWVNRRSGGHPFANPVLISVGLVILFLSITRMPYQRYFEGAQLIHFLLGPATVALAVPLFRHLDKVRRSALPILAGVVAGSATGVASVVVISWALGMEGALTASLTTKSITAPVAMGIAEHVGGVPSLAAVFAVLTGMAGAAFGPVLLDRLGAQESMERGLAMGTASHGQGTARILQDSEEAGAFSGLAMGLTALIMAVVMPLVARLVL